ncbi:hypothetical protein [Nakamurella endophytica]|uniref:Galactose oxidase n=1 Tax=Nakamurella endophytica TaxID=1748367 RepID=A0A917TB90_9ACTN|nr:hypothetical protein [Nakamurella endophytica]GGM17335.1 hypothetical protein GCM10011594_41750 [Nakamurella endophytica]
MTAWTGAQMLVWGGWDPTVQAMSAMADGASFDPATGQWQLLPQSPLTARASALSVWTGTQLLIWGGQSGFGEPLNDGAAYTPATGT